MVGNLFGFCGWNGKWRGRCTWLDVKRMVYEKKIEQEEEQKMSSREKELAVEKAFVGPGPSEHWVAEPSRVVDIHLRLSRFVQPIRGAPRLPAVLHTAAPFSLLLQRMVVQMLLLHRLPTESSRTKRCFHLRFFVKNEDGKIFAQMLWIFYVNTYGIFYVGIPPRYFFASRSRGGGQVNF